MAINRLILSEAIQAIGLPGVAGIALLLFSLSFAFSSLLPSWRELERHRTVAASARERLPEGAAPASIREASPAAELRAFYEIFPARSDAPALLSQVYAAAEDRKLLLSRGEYGRSTDPQTGLARYRIVLPVRGSYSQVREFVAATLQAVPVLALDEVSFERPKISEGEVEARIRLTLYLKGPA
jgi:Tfp pilus assembly protein PilO